MATPCGEAGRPPAVLVRGLGDVASAVAHRLARDGFLAVLHQGAEPPLAHRRKMSFADAWFDGRAELEGITAIRCDDPADLMAFSSDRSTIPLLTSSLELTLEAHRFAVLVDARMNKRGSPENQRGLTPLTMGLGPGFVAGGNVDWAIETSWGDRLGAVIRQGATLPLAGEPQAIANVGRERIVYAPCSGPWRTRKDIGQPVSAGETVAEIDGLPIQAPLDGTLRGIVRHGVMVAVGSKVLEVDPRPPAAAQFTGLGERSRRIAAGASEALAAWEAANAGARVSATSD